MLIGSRAHKFVNSYPQSADDCKAAAVTVALKERFGNKVFLAEVYVRQLIKMVIKNVGGSSKMYDKLDMHLRFLEVLGVTQDQSAAFSYPLVESSLPDDILKAWQRSAMSGYENEDSDISPDERLKSLMKFLRHEVKGAERLSYVQ